MAQQHKPVFISLPCRDLRASMAFFEALGYAFDPVYTSEQGASMVLGEGISAMLITEEFARSRAAKPLVDARLANEVIISLSCTNREEVDALMAKAVAAGGKAPRAAEDLGFMYANRFEDLDGHSWQLFCMGDMPQKG